MINILSKAKNPRSLQEFVSKIFSTIHHLNFDEKNRIVSVNGGEELELVIPIDTEDRRIEEWMAELDSVTKLTVKENITNFLQDSSQNADKLLPKYHSQTLMVGSSIIWTGDVEKAIEKGP